MLIFSLPIQADLLQSSTITATNTEYNNTSLSATNLRDDDPLTKWLSKGSSHTNNINFQFDANGEEFCFDTIDLVNYGNDDRSVNQFMLLTSNDTDLSDDISTSAINWQPAIADPAPTGLINYLSWAQGGRLISADSQYNTTNYGAKNINDGSTFSKWLSKGRQGNNILEYNFDSDWDGNTGNGIPIEEIEISNYGNNDISIKELQIEVTTDGTNWFKLEVPGSMSGDLEYVYTRSHEGGILGNVDSQYNTTTYAAENLHDGDQLGIWLSKSRQGNNNINFTFDPNNNGITGADGDSEDLFTIDKIYLENYGTDDRAIREFQVEVKTLSNPIWSKIGVPGSSIGVEGYDFLLSHHGGELVTVGSELNSTSWAAANLNDGDHMTLWLSKSYQSNNTFEFQFDANEDGMKDADDYFTLDSFYLQNYGVDDRSIKEFQVSVKTASNTSWKKLKVPGAAIGDANYNFLLKDQGGILVAVDSQLNTSSWAAENIHDGSEMSRWLSASRQSNNSLEFQFDADEDGNTATASDLFTMESFYLVNYGNDDRSIREFQVAVKTASNPNWTKLKVPGATVGISDHNFLLEAHGGILTAVDSQLNTSSYAAQNIHDGNQMSLWFSLNAQLSNTLDFQFDVDEDGITGTSADLFTMEKFYLQNYGNDDISIKNFQVEVKTSSNTNWTKLPVLGTAANDPDYNFVLADNGGALTLIDSQYNTSNRGAKNIHDGSQISYWLSLRYQFINTLEFSFDTDNNGSTGDAINLDTIELINYGEDDISIKTFEIDIKIGSGAWQTIDAPEGGTVFTANMDRNGQKWTITPQTNVTATRLRTLTNYGDSNYIGAREIVFSGDAVAMSNTFTAQMDANGETFTLVTPISNVTDVRLRTISNYGDYSYVGAREFKILGPSTIESSTFVAAMHGDGESFILDSDDILVDVTDVKLMTISNHGDSSYVGAKEFKVLGSSLTETATFVAAMHGDGETFTLDSDDIPVDVTDVKLTTISNYGDGSYVGAKDFKVLGNSITETKTFVAAMHGNGETFVLDSDDVPVDVTDVKLVTINNYGDNTYVGAKEFEIIGHSITPAHTFILPMQSEPYRIALDDDDTVTGVIGARIVTISNHGDGNYIGAAEFKLLGSAIGPSYVFEATMDSSKQQFDFETLTGNLFRFHTLNNHGDPSYTGAAELVLNSAKCPTGNWRMNELSWSGVPGEVIDSSGGGHSGTVFGIGSGLADPNTDNSNPAIAGNPGTCRYGEFDGVDDYIEIPDSEDLDNTAKITLSAWFNAKSFVQTNGTNARGLFSKRPSFSNDISYGAFFWNGNGNKLYIDIDAQNDRFASNTSFNLNTWYHIAIVFDGTQIASERVRLYVNGALDGVFYESSSSIPDTSSNFYIGNLFTSLTELKVFDGAIDEVSVIPEALTQSQVSALYAETHECSSLAVHHYEIVHDGQGLTCDTESVTVKACTNESCETLSDESVTLDFQVIDTASTVTTINSPTFTGSTNVNFNHTTAETLTLSLANATATATDPLVCDEGNSSSCDIAFTSAGFRFIHNGDPTLGLPNQTSGSVFNETLQLQAVKDSSGVCTAFFENGNDKLAVELSQENIDPGGSDGLSFSINGSNIAKHSSVTSIALDFGANSIATIPTPMYRDAGQIRLHANYSDINGVTLAGSSNSFWVSPAKLVVAAKSGTVNLNAVTASSTPTHKAGEDFDLTISAYNSLGVITPNYFPGQMQFKLSRVGPTNHGVNGTLTYSNGGSIASELELLPSTFKNVTLDGLTFNNKIIPGVFGSSAAQYSEVGLLNLTVQDNDYGNTDIVIPAAAINIGRFIPDHFKQTVVENGSFFTTCNAGTTFAYSGQKDDATESFGTISYLTNPVLEITAYNKQGYITQNYYEDSQGSVNDYMKLSNTNVIVAEPTLDETAIGVDNSKLPLTANMVNGTLSQNDLTTIVPDNNPLPRGVLHYQLSDDDNFFYDRSANALVEPFISDIDFEIDTIIDTDNVSLILADGTSTTNDASPTGVEIRFARMVLQNSFGPETSNLPQAIQIEYFDNTGFIQTVDDNCSSYDASKVSLSSTNTSNSLNPAMTNILTDPVGGTGLFIKGKTQAILLEATGAENQGNMGVSYDAYDWLKFDWDNDGTHDNEPAAVATFGLFRGNDRIIYSREVFN
jgi:hypothetical protein